MAWFPIDQSPCFLSDEAEIVALTATSLSCSLEDLRSALHQGPSGEDQEDESDSPPEELIDAMVADAAEEISKRVATIGDGYPFSFDGDIITASASWAKDAVAYVFLLLISADGLPGLRTGRRHFEQVVTEALAQYLTGESLRFGFPRSSPVPSHPNQAVDFLARRIGERRVFTRTVKSSDKDMGVDAVAWKRFADALPSKVILLANCSTGANWKSKLGELSMKKWRGMIDFACDPVQVFAVPWILSQEDREGIVEVGNMVLDRSRTASLLAGWDAADEIRKWCRLRLKEATP